MKIFILDQKEDLSRIASTQSRVNNKENEDVILRRGNSLGKDDRLVPTKNNFAFFLSTFFFKKGYSLLIVLSV